MGDIDWEYLRDVLLKWRYRDSDHNDRKFISLHEAHAHKVQQAVELDNRGKAKEQMDTLEDILGRSGVKLWSTLQAEVLCWTDGLLAIVSPALLCCWADDRYVSCFALLLCC